MSLAERRDSIGNLGGDVTGFGIVSVIVKAIKLGEPSLSSFSIIRIPSR